jgi:hypothetical protein
MALLQPRNSGKSLWKSVNGVEYPLSAEGTTTELPNSLGNPDESVRYSLVTETARVERVSVYPWEGENGKPCFRISLELDPKLNPSNRTRRTETVTGLELEIEEKELTGLARLSGRKLDIHCLLPSVAVRAEDLEDKIRLLQQENEKLRSDLLKTEDQLQLALDLRRRST